MVKFPAYSKPVCLCLSRQPIPSLSAHFFLSYSLKSPAKWKKCIISIFKRQKRLAEIGLLHYQGFCKSRNNVAAQDLCCLHKPHQGPHLPQQQQAQAQASVLVSRWSDKSTHPPLPRRCMKYRWPVRICQDVYGQGAPSIYSIQSLLLKKTSLIWVPSAAV